MIPVSEISKRLADRVLTVCELLIPGGRVEGGEYVCGDITGGEGKSLKVHLNGGHPGKWRDWANDDDHKGDLLDLWRIRRNLSPGEAIEQAKEFLGINEPKPIAKKTYAKAPQKDYKVPHPEGKVLRWFAEKRYITAETVKAFQVSFREDADGMRWIVFPSYSPTGELINRSYRSFPKTPEEKKEVRQDKGCAPSLFGWQCLKPEAMETREIILCEGQIDAMSWWQLGFPVLSIPNGSGMTWLDYEFDNLQMFERIFIAFDMDEKGKEMRRQVIRRLGPHRCLVVEMPHKDANECLKAGLTASDACKWITGAKMPEFEGIIVGNELDSRLRAGRAVKEAPFTLKIFDADWEMRKGLYFRPGEVTIWTGNSGHGKSTLLNWIQLCATCKKMNVFIASLEVRAEKTMERVAHASLASEGAQRSDENIFKWVELLGHRFILSDLVGYISQDMLLDQMKFAFHRYGVGQFFIDSLMRIEGLEEDYPAQGKFLNKLQEFAKTNGVHIHLVAHPSKNKEGRVRMMDIKGSTLMMNNADNIVVVTKNPEKEALDKSADQGDELPEFYHKMHDTEVTVEKQRETGWVGTFYLKFNRHDLTFGLSNKYSPPKPDKKSFRKEFNQNRY